MNALTKQIRFKPGWDKRHPDPSKNYGIHGMDLYFSLVGEHGAASFTVYTNWFTPDVQRERDASPIDPRFPYMLHKPMGADLSYHAKFPTYEGQLSHKNCEYTGGVCYCDGSSLQAEELLQQFLVEGEPVVWARLERLYARCIPDVPSTVPALPSQG